MCFNHCITMVWLNYLVEYDVSKIQQRKVLLHQSCCTACTVYVICDIIGFSKSCLFSFSICIQRALYCYDDWLEIIHIDVWCSHDTTTQIVSLLSSLLYSVAIRLMWECWLSEKLVHANLQITIQIHHENGRSKFECTVLLRK